MVEQAELETQREVVGTKVLATSDNADCVQGNG
jgi:hypothetical protein